MTEELDFYLEKRVNTSVIIPKHRAWVFPANSYAVELWDALQASETRCKGLEEAVRNQRVFLEALEKTLWSRDANLAAVIQNHLRSTREEEEEA